MTRQREVAAKETERSFDGGLLDDGRRLRELAHLTKRLGFSTPRVTVSEKSGRGKHWLVSARDPHDNFVPLAATTQGLEEAFDRTRKNLWKRIHDLKIEEAKIAVRVRVDRAIDALHDAGYLAEADSVREVFEALEGARWDNLFLRRQVDELDAASRAEKEQSLAEDAREVFDDAMRECDAFMARIGPV